MAKGASDYKYHFINSPPDDVVCPLCLDIVEEPYQFTCCGQHICKKCKDKFKQQGTTTRNNTSRQTPRCPMCRQNKYSMLPDKYFERNTLHKLLIWCSEGCGQEIELGQLKSHLSQCPCIELDCPNGCGLKVQGQYMAEHKEKCPTRPFICCYCKYQSTYEVIVNEHHLVCDKYPIICPNKCSDDEIERGVLPSHLDNCPNQVLECEFSHVGCHEKIRRCDLSKHQSEQGSYHNALYFKIIYESLQTTIKKKDKQLEEKDKQLREKDVQLMKKDEELKEMLTQLEKNNKMFVMKFEKLNEAIQHKDRQLQGKDKQLNEKCKELDEKNQQLIVKDNEIVQQKDQLLKERNSQINKKDKQLQERNRQLQEKDEQLQKKLDHISFEVCALKVETKALNCLVGGIHHEVCGNVVLSTTMTGFTEKMNHKVQWFSDCYLTHFVGYAMCFEVNLHYWVFPHYSLCLYCHMMHGPNDDYLSWPFTGKIIIRLLNQAGDYDHYDYIFDYKGSDKGKRVEYGKERGEHLISVNGCCPFSKLLDNNNGFCQYLKDDCLQFEVIYVV